MGMKGLELPLNMIVLIIIAVLVLLVVAAVFTGYFSSGVRTISDSAALNNGCTTWRANACAVSAGSISIEGYQVPGTGGGTTQGTLADACIRNGAKDPSTGALNLQACRNLCICP